MKRNCVLLLVVAVLAIACPLAAAPIVVNGSFESPGLAGPTFQRLLTGSTFITGWTVIGASVDYVGTLWTAADLTYSVDLEGGSPGGVQQTLTGLTVGLPYVLSFDLAGNPDGGPAIKTGAVQVGSTTLDFQFDTTGMTRSSMGWTIVTLKWTPAATSELLKFTSSTGGGYGPVIDKVSAEAVPEPGSMFLVGAGLLAAGLWRRKH